MPLIRDIKTFTDRDGGDVVILIVDSTGRKNTVHLTVTDDCTGLEPKRGGGRSEAWSKYLKGLKRK